MKWKHFFLIIIFYLLAIFQFSFFPLFLFLKINPNLIFGFFLSTIFFEKKSFPKRENYIFIIYPFIAGLLLDIFSNVYLGTHITIFLILFYVINKLTENFWEGENSYIFYHFLIIFFVSNLFYYLFEFLIGYFIKTSYTPFPKIIFEILYTFLFCYIIFLIYRFFPKNRNLCLKEIK